MNDISIQPLLKLQPNSERPRERCLQRGASCLSLRECLALILASGPPGIGCLGLASKILDRPIHWPDPAEEERAFFIAMEGGSAPFLKDIQGLGPALQSRLLAAFEIGKRYSQYRCQAISSPNSLEVPELATRSLERIPIEKRMASHEWLGFVPVHRSGELGRLCEVEKGVRTHVNTDPAELFARILALRPFGYFLFHNHPSGITRPSRQDLDLTQRVGNISGQLGIRLFGHWIVAPQGEYLIET